jgi:hypothetical protein
LSRFLTPETQLSYGDLQHLSYTRRSEQHLQRVVPPWTASREAIQAVVIAKLKRYTRVTGCKKTEVDGASDLTTLELLARKSQRRMRRFVGPQFTNFATHLKSVKTRSLAALWVFELYAAYRLGRTSVDIAQQLGITPWSVRQHLFRLNQVARVICPELCAPARDFGGVHSRETYIDAKIAETEQRLKRAKGKRVPVYEARLATLRKMKEQRDTERRHATLYERDSSARPTGIGVNATER